MVSEQPIRYFLSRRQRLIPHLRIWGLMFTIFYILLESFFVIRFVVAVTALEWLGILTFGFLALIMFLLFRGLVFGHEIAARVAADRHVDDIRLSLKRCPNGEKQSLVPVDYGHLDIKLAGDRLVLLVRQ